MSKPTIVCTGMCNTKGTEVRFLAEMVAAHGGRPLIMDLSLGGAVDWADVSLQEVLACTDVKLQDVLAAPRAEASDLVGRAGAAKILELYSRGECDGVLSWAGSVGTSTATRVMRALPFGVPKIMLTDMTSGDIGTWVGNKDIYIVNPTLEQGINVVTRRVVANAAAGIVAMAQVGPIAAGSRPLCAITSYGTTTPTVLRCKTFMEDRGWDTAVFHAVGVGATMEDLVRSGLITAVLDITPAELINGLCQSPFRVPASWDGERLSAAGEMGIPQVVVPGGLDQVAYGALDSIPAVYRDDLKAGRRPSHRGTGLPYRHNEGVTIMVPTLDEVAAVARYMAGKLNRTKGPTTVVVPMRGWSAYDQTEAVATRERGWAEGNGDGPTWEPDPARLDRSARAAVMLKVLGETLDPSNDSLDLMAVDMHILDPELADLLNRLIGDMLDGTWKKGAYAELDIRKGVG
ncbi:MAG: Tm-1-like ATP-binding domain-containing protein [Candidatus Dormibacteria bacterium]|jgi:uncharacterized protein (UPF0261 family)